MRFFRTKHKKITSTEISVFPDKKLLNKKYDALIDKENTYLTAIDLIDKVIEFQSLTPDKNKWNLKDLKYNPPRYYRLLQLESLFSAFLEERNMTIENFLEAKFLNESTDYEKIFNYIKNWNLEFKTKINPIEISDFNNKSVYDIIGCFKYLINYLIEFHKLQDFHCNLSDTTLFTNRFSKVIVREINYSFDKTKIYNLKKVVGLICDQQERRISLYELVNSYKYPDLSISDVDGDWY